MRLRWVTWSALAAGLLEAAMLLAHGRLVHGFIYLSPHLAWMAPVANLLWFGAAFGLLALAGKLVPALVTPRATLLLAIFLGALSILLLPSQLHRVAALLIAAGVAIQGTRWILPRMDRFDRIVRRTLPLLGGATALAALSVLFLERPREGVPTTAARDGSPNVVLLVLDTVRKASLSLYGYEKPTTPAMERWAARGVRFDHAFTTASWTLPSHASMFNGRLPNEMNAGWLTPLDRQYPVLPERLAAAGYATAGFVANVLYCNRSFGLARGFHRYEDYRVSFGELVVNSSLGRALSERHLLRKLTGYHDILGRKSGAEITDRFLEWSAEQPGPWFAFLNYFDAHQPYLPPAEYAGRFGPMDDRNFGLLELRPYMGKIERAESELTRSQVKSEQHAYEAALAYLDSEVDRLLSALERRGALANTVVIITSDHGEQFMEHGLFDHGNSLYRYAIEVPLVMVGATGLPAGTVVSGPVSLRDIPATVSALAGLPDSFPGRSLVSAGDAGPVISQTRGPAPTRRFESIITPDFHAIWSADSVEVYRFAEDPAEKNNLAWQPGGLALVSGLRAIYDSLAGRPRQGR